MIQQGVIFFKEYGENVQPKNPAVKVLFKRDEES